MVMSYWVNFAANGDPNGSGLEPRPRYGARRKVQRLGQTIGPRVNDQSARFGFIGESRMRGLLPARWRHASTRDNGGGVPQ